MTAAGRGQGYWIQAEYGAGKTHLLATLGVLLAGQDGQAWEAVADSDIKGFKPALVGKTRLLPVILNCKGSLATEPGDSSLLRLLEAAISAALTRAGLQGKATISTSDEVREWWEKKAPQGVRADITRQVQSRFTGHPTPEDLLAKKGEAVFAKAIIEAAKALNLEIPLSRDVRARFKHIYEQLTTQLDYDGLLVIIDEFKSWQDLHPDGTAGFAEAEHVLETLAFHLPVDDRARVTTVVASQSAPPAKLSGGATGDRFRTFPLFAREESAREYDEIVAFRVREVRPDRLPEVDQYYNHYFQKFRFLSQTKKEYFRQTFPFQPRCFETIRNIAKRELATARSSIHYVHEALSQPGTLERPGLIKVCDLLRSENLVKDLQTAAYKDAYASYQSALQALPTLFEDDGDQQLAEDVLKTLFLTYCAAPEAPRGLTAAELAEACLATDEDLKSEDLVQGIILSRLKELSQVEYTNKEKGAFFRVSQVSGPTYTQILAAAQRKVDNDNEAAEEWRKLLKASLPATDGVPMLFAEQTLDRPGRVTGRNNKVRYDGEKVVSQEWSKSWGGAVVDKTNYNQHFRLVYLLEPAEVRAEDLADERIAVIVPAAWKGIALDEMRRYCAILRVEREYAVQQGPDAEEIKQSNRTKKREVLEEVRRRQLEAYRKGRIVTKAGLGIDPHQVFAAPDKADEAIAAALLAHSYRQPPFDHEAFKRELAATEPSRLFAALFQESTASADKGALENFGAGLGLTSKNKPAEFAPEHCPFFATLRQELEQAKGDLRLYSFYEKYTGPPWGLPVDLLSLYLVAFVRHARPQCYLSVKPEAGLSLSNGRALRDHRFGYNEVPLLTWTKNKLHRSFDRLVQESGPGWNDFIAYFRALDDTLLATDSPRQVAEQQVRLQKAQTDLAGRSKGLRSRLASLAERLNEKITEPLAALDKVGAVCATDTHHLSNFAEMLAEQFDRDEQQYQQTFAQLRKIEELDRSHLAALTEAVAYLGQVEYVPEGSALAAELQQARAAFSLKTFCAEPSAAAAALQQFYHFRDQYGALYQAHYRDYRDRMNSLHAELETLGEIIQGLVNINSVADLGRAIEPALISRHQELLKRTDASHLQAGLPDVEKRPLANNVRLDTQAPNAAVAEFKSDLEVAQMRGLELLSPPAIQALLQASADEEIARLLVAINTSDFAQTARLFTRAIAAQVKELLRQAKMVVVEVTLADYGPLQIGDAPQELAEAVQKFEQFLRWRIADAQRANPDKIVRLNLK